jgi:tripeptide aminopeptidase
MEIAVLAALPPVAQLMVRLCEIPSPSREEGAVAEILRAELLALGAELSEDDAAERLPAGCGNILARFPPTVAGGVPIAFAAHLDTVPQLGPIEVELADGVLRNRHPTILGSDNKAAVAALVIAMQRVVDEGLPHAGIEILLTPCEEIGLKGGAHVDTSKLRSRVGFVYDHTGDIGDIVGAAPSLRRIEATFLGRAAHAGIVPEAGRNAIAAAARAIARMPLGRIDPDTTANVGVIAGGTAANVVAESCTLVGEARSRDERALAGQIMTMLDALAWAASESEVDLQTRVRDEFTGYRLSEADQQVRLAWRALEACGHRPRLVPSGGGSDVNAFLRNGFPCVNLCNGSTDVHTPNERIAVKSLTDMVEVTLAIIDAARAEPAGR